MKRRIATFLGLVFVVGVLLTVIYFYRSYAT